MSWSLLAYKIVGVERKVKNMDICSLEFEGKKVPVTFNEEKTSSRLAEAKYMLEKASLYFNSIKLEQSTIDEAIAEEVISSSYIEGYEVYFTARALAENGLNAKKGVGTHADKAVLCGYRAYKELLGVKGSAISNKKDLLSTWRTLIKYKPLLTNFRIVGVRVGNRFETVHVAPNAKCVRGMLDNMFDSTLPKYSDNVLLQSIIFHYIFTFIHPFADGNGRTARLIEQEMLMNHYNMDMCIPLSSAILQDKRLYYSTFNSGQTFGASHLDVLSIDISDFINNNCRFISQGIQKIMVANGYENDVQLPKELEQRKDGDGSYSREEAIEICGGVENYCNLLLTARIRECDYGMSYSKYREEVYLN